MTHSIRSNILRTVPILVIVSLLLLTACSRLTEANLEKVHNGMTTDQVKAILGPPTSMKSSSMLGLTGTTYMYHTPTSDVQITFLNDQVMATEGEFK